VSESRANVVALPHGRVPPHNLDAEISLLGGVLLDNQAFDEVLTIVRGADFYRTAHRIMFEAMADLAMHSEPIDRVKLKDRLVSLGKLEDVGGEEAIDKLDVQVPTAANLVYYAKIVADKALARRAIETASSIAQLGYEQHGDVHAFVDESEARFFELRSRNAVGDFKSLHEMIRPVFEEIERRSAHDGKLIGVSSGLERLDDVTNGFKPGNLVIVAARPSMGKSALAKGIALSVARRAAASATSPSRTRASR
jgi:replicative DNA helicase